MSDILLVLLGFGMLGFVAVVLWLGWRHPEWRGGSDGDDDENGDVSGWGTG